MASSTAPVTSTTYTYDYADRLASVLRAGVQVGYSWSDRGELLSGGVQHYAWDAAGRLVGVTGPANLDVSYTYNGANDRVEMTVDGAATAYVVDPFNPVESVSENSPLSQVLVETTGEEATRYLYGLDLLGHSQDSVATYYGYDAQNLRLHLDGSGEIAAQYRYGPFGEIVGDGPDGYGYSGEQWHGEVGLLYLRARYYRPEAGRFVSRDRWPADYQRPVTIHRYSYVGNEPINHRDPSGLCIPIEGDKCSPPPEEPSLYPLPRKVYDDFRSSFRDLSSWQPRHINAVLSYYNNSDRCQNGKIPYIGCGDLLTAIAQGFSVGPSDDPFLWKLVTNRGGTEGGNFPVEGYDE